MRTGWVSYSGLFSKGFHFWIFRRGLFCKNKFPSPNCYLKIYSNDWIKCLFALTWLHYLCSINAFCSFIDISSGCHIQKAQNPKHCHQLLMRPPMKLCTLAAHCFETTEGASQQSKPSSIFQNIMVTQHNNLRKYLSAQNKAILKYLYKHDSHALSS